MRQFYLVQSGKNQPLVTHLTDVSDMGELQSEDDILIMFDSDAEYIPHQGCPILVTTERTPEELTELGASRAVLVDVSDVLQALTL